MKIFIRFLVTAVLGASCLAPATAFKPEFAYGEDKIRGVNLGGWLIIQPWITPTIFEATGNPAIVDEYTYTQLVDRNTATKVLAEHWASFITENDLKEISEAGLNHVRIPIGYWAFDVGPGEPYIQGQLPYLVKAVSWAKKYGLKVILDLYGAPGSQNGEGQSGQVLGFPGWASNQTNVERTNAIVKTMVEMFGDDPTVPIIAPLAKPAGYIPSVLNVTRQYWLDSYQSIRYPDGPSKKEGNTVEMISWSWKVFDYWQGFMTSPTYEGVMMDYQIYDIFTVPDLRKNIAEHVAGICHMSTNLTSYDLWFTVGEWSPVITDCAKGINGWGNGSLYDGTWNNASRTGSCEGLSGNASTFSHPYKTKLRMFWEAQVITYEKAQGWVMWTWKTASEDWSYQAGLKYGWIPKNPTDLKYPDICEVFNDVEACSPYTDFMSCQS